MPQTHVAAAMAEEGAQRRVPEGLHRLTTPVLPHSQLDRRPLGNDTKVNITKCC